MKKIITTISFSFLLALGLVNSSYAVSLEGLGIGASLSHGGFYAEGTEKEESKDTGVDHTTEAGAFTADFGSIFVEYNFGPIAIGLDYIPAAIETPQNTNVQGTLNNTVKGEFENHTTLYAIVPIPLGGLYLKAGAIYVDLNSVETLETGGSYGNTDTSGITAGLGYSFEAGSGVNIRAEVMAAEYDSVSLTNSGVNADALTQDDTDTTITLDEMYSAKATISIVKTF